jgi:hypothetical protein
MAPSGPALINVRFAGNNGHAAHHRHSRTQGQAGCPRCRHRIVTAAGLCAVYYKPPDQTQLIPRLRTKTDDYELLDLSPSAAYPET